MTAGRVMKQRDRTDSTQEQKLRHGRGLLRRFGRHDGGSAVIEFAVLALPFFLLVFAILESSISFAAQQMLANATDDMARQFRTGQQRPDDLVRNENLMKEFICERIRFVVAKDCPGLLIDLKSYDTFEQAAASRIPLTSDGDLDEDRFGVDLGRSGAKNQLRVFYRWPVLTDFMRKSTTNLPDGKALLYAMVTWQNEPFDDY